MSCVRSASFSSTRYRMFMLGHPLSRPVMNHATDSRPVFTPRPAAGADRYPTVLSADPALGSSNAADARMVPLDLTPGRRTKNHRCFGRSLYITPAGAGLCSTGQNHCAGVLDLPAKPLRIRPRAADKRSQHRRLALSAHQRSHRCPHGRNLLGCHAPVFSWRASALSHQQCASENRLP
jgi:hypothetical protein